MKHQIQEIVFKKLLKDVGIEPAEVEVVVTPESNVERFYKWLQMCKNQFINDEKQLTRAFRKVYLNS